jgi:hypothetical protein
MYQHFFESLQNKLQLNSLEDWYNVRYESVFREDKTQVLAKEFGNSLVAALKWIYPEHNWLPWKFIRVQRSFWEDYNHQREFLDVLGSKLGYSQLDDWYNVRAEDIVVAGGESLLRKYNGAVMKLLQSVYTHPWIVWKFKIIPHGFWDSLQKQREFLEWLRQKLGIRQLDEWYNVSPVIVVENGGGDLLWRYKSLNFLLQSVYSEHHWNFNTEQSFSDKQETQFMQSLGQKLGYRQLEDWYDVTRQDFSKNGGNFLLSKYGNSFPRLLQTFYPLYNWKSWKFCHLPHIFWILPENQREFLDFVGMKLGF